MTGGVIHNDYAKYQISLEVNIHGGRTYINRDDIKDMFTRISSITIPHPWVPIGELSELPICIKNHIGERKTFKIEWMFTGRYMCSMSNDYATNMIVEDKIKSISLKNGIPPKLVDYCNLVEYDMPYRMWCESLSAPGSVVSYTGTGFWNSDKKVCFTTVRIMSIIVNHEYIITATTCGRGSKYTF